MPAFPSLFRPKLLVLSAALSLGEDKPESNQPRPEPRTQQSTIQTTTHNWANIPTFSVANETTSPRLGKNTNSLRTPSQPPPRNPAHRAAQIQRQKVTQRKTASKTAASKENRQSTNPQPANSENLPRNPTTTHFPASAKTAPQPQDGAVRREQSLGNTLCASCHSTMLVNNARKTSGDWRKTTSKMENQGMPKPPPPLREPLIRVGADGACCR